ncbi:MAG TPA: YihY/virulence factor BrkB family protein [Thermoanaerobaculia bacterium]|nr:YihY/virulence factor BrkB family protein [Thermoanaerobaculia bacterium]
MTQRGHGSVDWLAILRETFHLWIERDAFTYSAALAFFALFSLGPVLVVFTEGAALIFDPAAVRRQIIGQFDLLMGHDPALAVDAMLGRAAVEMHGILARLIAVATFVIGTLSVFVQLQDSLNRMWDVAPKPGPLLRHLLWKRVVSFALLLGLGFVMVVSLVLSTTLHAVQAYAERHADFPSAVFETGNAIVSWLLVTLLFALLYRVLPDVEIPWRDVWAGALLTSLLLSVGKWAIGFYMGRSAIALEYGTAGSMIVMLFWVYFASLLVLLGAVFTRVQARHFEERRLSATKGAVRVKRVKQELET